MVYIGDGNPSRFRSGRDRQLAKVLTDHRLTDACCEQCERGRDAHISPANHRRPEALGRTFFCVRLTIFLSHQDGIFKNPRKWFDTALAKAEIKDVTWHTLRHTFASRLVMRGVDLKTVQELMGHKTIAMTFRYAHLAPSHKAAALKVLVSKAS